MQKMSKELERLIAEHHRTHPPKRRPTSEAAKAAFIVQLRKFQRELDPELERALRWMSLNLGYIRGKTKRCVAVD